MQTLLTLTRTDRDLRRVLRHRFAQNLSPNEPLTSLPGETFADEDVLTHLLALTIARPNSVEEGRALYANLEEDHIAVDFRPSATLGRSDDGNLLYGTRNNHGE